MRVVAFPFGPKGWAQQSQEVTLQWFAFRALSTTMSTDSDGTFICITSSTSLDGKNKTDLATSATRSFTFNCFNRNLLLFFWVTMLMLWKRWHWPDWLVTCRWGIPCPCTIAIIIRIQKHDDLIEVPLLLLLIIFLLRTHHVESQVTKCHKCAQINSSQPA